MRALLLAAGLLGASAPAPAADAKRGEALIQEHCAACHAVGRAGDSPVATAPRFRELGRRYPIENLQEALAEGIAVNHEGIQMPEFAFAPDEVDDILAHLKRIQAR
jgi:mono/diheme cytochrome c family protein